MGTEWDNALADGGVSSDRADEAHVAPDEVTSDEDTTAANDDVSPTSDSPSGANTSSEQTGVFADGSPVPTDNPGTTVDGCTSDLAVTPLTKLSTVQYRNTVRDLLARVGAGAVTESLSVRLSAIPDDSRGALFRGMDARVGLEHIEGYYNVAKTAADAIIQDDDLLSSVAAACAIEDDVTDACVDDFVDSFGQLAFRKPLSDSERTELLEPYRRRHDGA